MTELQQLTEHVWVYPHNPDHEAVQPAVGMIVTARETVLVDAGNSPRHARRILSELWRIGAPLVSHIIYTHHHWDHIFGAQIFGGTIIAHEQCRDLIAERYAAKPWGSSYIQDEMRQNPARARVLQAMQRAVEDWRGFRVMLPEIVFSRQMTLYLDGLTVEMRHVGGQHAPESVTVEVVEEKVLFVGDSYYPPPLLTGKPGDTPDLHMAEAFLQRGLAWYVEGHNKPLTHTEFQQQLTANL